MTIIFLSNITDVEPINRVCFFLFSILHSSILRWQVKKIIVYTIFFGLFTILKSLLSIIFIASERCLFVIMKGCLFLILIKGSSLISLLQHVLVMKSLKSYELTETISYINIYTCSNE